MVGGDLHTDLYQLAGAVGGDYLARGVLTSSLVTSGSVVSVSTQSTSSAILIPLDRESPTESLIVFIVLGSVVAISPHRGSRGWLDQSRVTSNAALLMI